MYRNLQHTIVFALLALIIFSACEDVIPISLEESEPILIVDGYVTNEPGPQTIRLTTTRPYFNTVSNPVVTGATVQVTDSEGNTFDFADQGDGNYVWQPNGPEPLGVIGRGYTLMINTAEGEQYRASSSINRVPEIDSITFELRESELGSPAGHYAEVFARDLPGSGDTYWIRTYKNGIFLNKGEEINIAFDASFSEGANSDGIVFITPIREGINPIPDEIEEENDLPPYSPGDSVYVEIYSITQDAFFFLQQVQIQTVNGGLFAVPAANVPSNVENITPGSDKDVQGWFGAAAVSGAGRRLEE